MIRCPACGTDNRDGSKFCASCGEELSALPDVICPNCGTQNPALNVLCYDCLSPLHPEEEDAAGEDPELAPKEIDASESEVTEPGTDESTEQPDLPEEEPSLGELVGTEQPEGAPLPPAEDIAETDQSLAAGVDGSDQPGVPVAQEPADEEAPPDQETEPQAAEGDQGDPPESAAQESELPAEPKESVRTELETDASTVPEETESIEPSEEPREPLDSIEGALPLENIMALPHRSESPDPVKSGLEEVERATLLGHELLVPRLGEETRRPAFEGRGAVPGRGMRAFLYILLCAAIVVPLVVGGHWFGSSITPRECVRGAFEAIDALPSGSTVLLAVECDPATADEVEPAVAAVLDHLLERKVSIVGLSTVPSGPPVALQWLEEAAQRAGGLAYGTDYILLGYLPGEESALRRMPQGLDVVFPRDYARRQDASQYLLIQRANRLSSMGLGIVIGGDHVHVKRWLEQVQAPVGLPLLAVMTASAEPALSPYYRSGQLLGMVGGLPGAAEYEALRQRVGPASESADAQALAYLVVVVAGLLGNVAFLLGRRKPETADASPERPDSGERANG